MRTIQLFVIVWVLFAFAANCLAEEPLLSVAEVRNLSDQQLRTAIEKENLRGVDHYLLEIVRRGGPEWAAFLEQQIKVQHDALQEWLHADGEPQPQPNFNLFGVRGWTTLRRVQRKPDPLQILIGGKLNRHYSLKELPRVTFHVMLTNLDEEKQPIEITEGGDYRSGRKTRWRIEAHDSSGKMLPVVGNKEIRAEGGIFTSGVLEFGESWDTQLFLGSYVQLSAPGDYILRFRYHDSTRIAHLDKCDDLLTSNSLPLRIHVDPIELDVTDTQRADAKTWIGDLPNAGLVKFLVPEYSEECYEFIDPESPEGKLLTLDWAAVPELILAANDSNLEAGRRARVFALLYSITRYHFPCQEPGILGKRVYGPRENYRTDTMLDFFDEVDEKKQLEFAKRWQIWLDKEYIRIR